MNQESFAQLNVGSRVRITDRYAGKFFDKIGTITYLSRFDENGCRGGGVVFSAEDNPECPQQAYWFREHEWMAL